MSSLAAVNTTNRKGPMSPSTNLDDRAKTQTKFQEEAGDGDGDDSDDDEGGTSKGSKKATHRKIKIEYIDDKSRRHITFSKRKAGIMKKAYELSTLTGTQVLLLVVSETGLVYTFTTPKLQPLVTKPEGKNLIQACLNAPDAPSANTESSSSAQQQQQQQRAPQSQSVYPDQVDPSDPIYGGDDRKQHAGAPYNPAMMYQGSYGAIPPAMPINQNYIYGPGYNNQPIYGAGAGQYMPTSQNYPVGWNGGAAAGMGKFPGHGGDKK